MIKLLMKWDIKPGRETAYLDFISQKFTPAVMQLGMEPTEVWYTYWGEGPQILMGLVAPDMESLKQVLVNPEWEQLHEQLAEHVINFERKIVPAVGRFQM